MSAITAKESRKMKKYAVLTREPRCFLGSFDFSWEQRKFGEITSKYEDPVPTPHDGYYRLGIRSHAKGTFHSYVAKGQELETAQMHRVAAGNFIVNITFGWEHAVAITDKNDAGKLVSHRFPQFSFAEGMVPEFFRYVIVDEKFRHHLWLASPGGAGRNRVLKLDEMLNYLMRFPSRGEQIKIAEFFRHLDNLITLHQRKCANLCSPSRVVFSLLFATSTFSWEQRKFSNITFPAGEKNKDNLPLESYSITNEHGFVPQDEKFENGGTMREADKRMYYIVSPNSFAYNPARINVGSIGYQNVGKNVIVSSLYEVFKTSEDVDDRLLWHWFKSPDFQKLIMQLQEGGVRLYFYYDKLCMGEVSLPSLEEQRKIGKLLDTLDNLITLHQRECISFTGKSVGLIQAINKKQITSSWEQRKFSNITFPAGEKNKDNLPLESYSITNEHGFVPQDEKFENGGTMREADKRMYYIVSPNSFAYNPARINVGSIGYQNVGKNVIVSSLYEVFKTSEDVDDRLLWHWFKSPDFQKLIMQLQEGGVRLYFYYDKLCMGEVSLPSLEEQRKIGKLLDTLDNLITLHQRKPFLMKWRTSDANRNQTNRLVL